MGDTFKNLIEQHFHAEMYEALSDEVEANYAEYDLTRRANIAQEVLEANVNGIELLKVSDIEQDDDEVSFKVLVNSCIEIGDYAYGEEISEEVAQWFELSCSAILEDAELTDFSVDDIKICNKK